MVKNNDTAEQEPWLHLQNLPRISLAHLPTPLEELPRLTRMLGGPKLFIKRDDLTGLALGGNKVRKLEFLIADALAQGADTVITAGAAQSNHCRQTAAAAVRAGLNCTLVLGGKNSASPNGNLLLDHILGAEICWTAMERRGERMAEIANKLRLAGHKPYVIPYGGSNPVGAVGYALAMVETMQQFQGRHLEINHIIFASSSGGTQAGLVVGAKLSGFKGQLIGISIDKGERSETCYETELAQLSNGIAERIGMDMCFGKKDMHVEYDYLGGGYGVVGELERDAIRLLARQEGILLDPVYTGRAMGALLDMVRRKSFSQDDNVLFWHTGGSPALFAYTKELR